MALFGYHIHHAAGVLNAVECGGRAFEHFHALGGGAEYVGLGHLHAAAVIGFTAAFAGYGGFLIPKSFGTALSLWGSVNGALIGFILFYIICAGLNWWYYARKNAEAKC